MSELQIKILDAIQVGKILSRLPSTWNDYKNNDLILGSKLSYDSVTPDVGGSFSGAQANLKVKKDLEEC